MPYTDVKKYHPEPVLPTSPAFSLTVSPSAVVSYAQALKYTAPPEVPPPPSHQIHVHSKHQTLFQFSLLQKPVAVTV